MRALIVPLLLLSVAVPTSADETPAPEKKASAAQGWRIPAGEEARFATDERECARHAMSPRGRRADPRKLESCMKGRGWQRE
jgi:hypothetical protein